jgi:hypothetical protein
MRRTRTARPVDGSMLVVSSHHAGSTIFLAVILHCTHCQAFIAFHSNAAWTLSHVGTPLLRTVVS